MTSHLSGDWVPGRARARASACAAAPGSYVVYGMDGQEPALIAGRTPATEGDAWGTEPPERWGRLQRGDDERAGAERARALGHVLPGVRRGRPRRGPGPGRPARRDRQPHRDRRDPRDLDLSPVRAIPHIADNRLCARTPA